MTQLQNDHSPAGYPLLPDRPVARVGFGVMQIERGGPPEWVRSAGAGVLRRAIELGVNHLDTAEFYGAGLLNETIRSALAPYPDDLVLATKVGAEHHPEKRLVAAQRPDQLRAQVETNLRSLGVEQVGVVNLRRLDAGPGIIADGEQSVDLDSQLDELTALRDAGKIGGIGLSNVSLEQLQHALPVGIVCVQNAYSLLDRSNEALLAECRRHDIAWVPFFPLGSGFPNQPKVTDQPVVIAAARTRSVTAAQIGLAWLLQHAPNILLIPGTASVVHLEENVAAGQLSLDEQTVAALDGLAVDGLAPTGPTPA